MTLLSVLDPAPTSAARLSLSPDMPQVAAIAKRADGLQPVSHEMRVWIIDRAGAGESIETMLHSMVTSGWQLDAATAVMHEVLEGAIHDPLLACGLPPARAVPEPSPPGSAQVLQVGGRNVSVLMNIRNPRVVVFGGLLSDAECDELIAQASERLTRSEVIVEESGDSAISSVRTSDGMFFEQGQSPLCRRIEARMADLMGWPVENGEGLQVLRYRPGAQYTPHYDYFDPTHAGSVKNLLRGGQRVASLVCYLNTPTKGGATVFPELQLEVAPVKGNAVFFSYDRPHPVSRSLHGGAPVVEGEKWVATKWVREGRFR